MASDRAVGARRRREEWEDAVDARRTQHRAALLTAGLVTAGMLGLAGCSGGSGSAAGHAASSGASASGRAPGAAEAQGAGSAGGAKTPASQARTLLTTRSLVVTVARTVRVRDLSAAARAASAAAASLAGRVDGEQAHTDPDTGQGSYTVTLRVPVDRVDRLVAAVESEGVVLDGSRSVQDVTQRAQDVSARLASARASVDRVRGLYQRAGTLTAVLQVERELAAREADLESLEQQSTGIRDSTTLATVTATFVTATAPAVQHAGFVPGLRSGWHGLVTAVVLTLTALGAVTPFLPALVILLLLVWAVRRHLRRGLRRDGATSLTE